MHNIAITLHVVGICFMVLGAIGFALATSAAQSNVAWNVGLGLTIITVIMIGVLSAGVI